MSTDQVSTPVSRRKNGTIPSCENCRIAKARCDHQEPCSRCTRQGKTCYFHPAPMSRLGRSHTDQLISAKRRRTTPSTESPKPAPPLRRPSAPTPNPLLVQGDAPLGYSRLPAQVSLSYMGRTGFGAILEENEPNGILENPEMRNTELNSHSAKDQQGPWRKFGSSILTWIPSLAPFEESLDRCLNDGSCVALDPYTLAVIARRYHSTFKSLLDPSRGEEGLGRISDILTANTRKPLPVPSTNQEWLDSFTGANSRWEAVGLVLSSAGSAAFARPVGDSHLAGLLTKNMGRKELACSMLEAADAALMISEAVSASRSVLHICLLGACVQLQSMIVGDTDLDLWQRLGGLAATVTSMGLHLRASEAERRSALYFQTRTKGFCMAFELDKFICTFSGRPPCLSRRFISVDLPLDTSYSSVFNESSIAELEKHIGPDGWSRDGQIFPWTIIRSSTILNFVRDEILELALSPLASPVASGRMDDLRRKIDETWNSFPSRFHTTIDKKSLSNLTNRDAITIMDCRLLHLHNIFLAERIEQQAKDEQRLLEAAREMVSIVVLFWSMRDRFPAARDQIHWFICCYGIPAGSALSIDLWRQTVSPLTSPPSNQRASTIQNLSLFVACLEWIEPDDGNYSLCGRVSKVIKNILERALAPEVEPALPSIPGYDLTDISLADMPAFGQELDSWFDSTGGWGSAMQY